MIICSHLVMLLGKKSTHLFLKTLVLYFIWKTFTPSTPLYYSMKNLNSLNVLCLLFFVCSQKPYTYASKNVVILYT